MNIEQLVSLAQSGNQEAYQEILLAFQPLARKYASFTHLCLIKEDVFAEANLAIAEAVMNYDPVKNDSFAGYAKACVHYRVWNYFQKERRKWDREYLVFDSDDDKDGLKEQPGAGDFTEEVIQEIVDNKLRIALAQAFSRLTNKQKYVISTCILKNYPSYHAAKTLGITTQAVSRIKKRALQSIRVLLGEDDG